MSDHNYDSYRYDNSSRRTIRADSRNTAEPDRPRYSSERRRRYEEDKGPSILYDARGVRVKKSKLSSEFMKTLLFFVVPYIIINGIIFCLVTATPKIEIRLSDTNDYQTVKAGFTVSSLLPLKDLTVTLDSEEIPYTKSGSSGSAVISKNGTFYIEATAINGMHATALTEISVLDDTPPLIDDASCHIEEGVLSFKVSDTQSGVDWAKICAVTPDGKEVRPTEYKKESGLVRIPMEVDEMELVIYDLVGNKRTATVTATEEQLTVNGPVVE